MPKIVVNSPQLLTIPEATKALGIAEITFYRWMRAGKIQSLKLGHHTLIPISEIERLSDESQQS